MRREAPGEVALYYHSETRPGHADVLGRVRPRRPDPRHPAARTRRQAGRPGRLDAAEHPPGRHRHARDHVDRGDLDERVPRLRLAGRARPLPAAAAHGADLHRRLHRTTARPTTAPASSSRSSTTSTCLEHVIYLPFGDVPAPADGAKSWPELLAGPAGVTGRVHVSPRPVRDAAVDLVLQRHHRTAESHHPQPRRHPARAAQAAAPEHEPVRRRRAVLLHHHRVDDVELHGQLAGARGEAAAVRREPRATRSRTRCGGWPPRRR